MFQARPITGSTLRAAFAVVQLALPDASFSDFRRQIAAGNPHNASGAVIGIFDRRDYVHAVFLAHSERRIGQPARLKVSDFTHGDSISTKFTIEMIEAVECWARSIGCDAILFEAMRAETAHGLPLADVLVAHGFSGESLVLARRI